MNLIALNFHAAPAITAPNSSAGQPLTETSIACRLNEHDHNTNKGGDELAPTREPSAKSKKANNFRLPSISSFLPDDDFHQEFPSSGQGYVTAPSPSLKSDGPPFPAATGRPDADQSASIPAGMPVGIDQVSIDGVTIPQIGDFLCTYPSCSAQPFQTKYLLNSYANVHSSERPYYCPMKDCPRSQGHKGFKRKNEMIRHGLVYRSPSYICPYCTDREHKYPRPDNLQRSVSCYICMVINVLRPG